MEPKATNDVVSEKLCAARRETLEAKRDGSIKEILAILKENRTALEIAATQADRQYEHLNNLRQDMIQRDVYNADMQGIKKSEKLIYVGLGLVIALQFILSIFIE